MSKKRILSTRQGPDFSPEQLAAASPVLPDVLPPAASEQFDARQRRLEVLTQSLGLRPGQTALARVQKDSAGRSFPELLESITHRSPVPFRHEGDRVLGKRAYADTKLPNSISIPANYQAKAGEESDILNSYWGWVGIIEPEYDLLEPWTLLDVESYFKEAVNRRLSLAFRNGVEIVGENQAFADYIQRRLDQMGFVMEKSFMTFLKDVLWNLYVCSNCIVVKIRDTQASGGQANEKNSHRTPVAGYKIVPPSTIYPWLNGRGQIEKWRRFFGNGRPWRDYAPEDILHFKWDVKPGHLFGTPRSTTFRDDIFALRRLEENVELLLVNHLFPLFHVAVGSEKAPCQILANGVSEIDYVRHLIEGMPKEGVFVTDERVVIEVHGAAKEGIDPHPILEHYEKRTIAGMGLSPLDLGIADTANRSTADNVSQNLKDSIIADLLFFSDQVKMGIFKELFAESPTNLSVQNATADVHLEFHEIDVDTKIKKENHAVNLFNSNTIDQDEVRRVMKRKPMTDEGKKKTNHEMQTMSVKKFDAKTAKELAEMQMEHQKEIARHQAKVQGETARHVATATKTTKVTRKFANGGGHTKEVTEPVKGAARAVATRDQPANQHGKNLDPHKAKSSQDPELLSSIHDRLAEACVSVESFEDALSLVAGQLFSEELRAQGHEDHFKSFFEGADALRLQHALECWAADPIPQEKVTV